MTEFTIAVWTFLQEEGMDVFDNHTDLYVVSGDRAFYVKVPQHVIIVEEAFGRRHDPVNWCQVWQCEIADPESFPKLLEFLRNPPDEVSAS